MSDRPSATPPPPHIVETAQAIAELRAAHLREASPAERRLERVAASVSTPGFVTIVTLFVVLWLAANLLLPALGLPSFDPPPTFALLQGVLTALTVYMTLAILTAQRRTNILAELRAQVTLEHSILTEHKAAKMIELLEELRRDHPEIANRPDREARAMAKPTDPRDVAAAIADSHADLKGEN
jgi:uncharacterized membrane protein